MKDDIQSVNSGISHEDVHSYCNCTISHDRCKTDQMISVSQSICNPFCKHLLKILFNVYIFMYIQQMVNRDSLDNRCIKKKIIINYT